MTDREGQPRRPRRSPMAGAPRLDPADRPRPEALRAARIATSSDRRYGRFRTTGPAASQPASDEPDPS